MVTLSDDVLRRKSLLVSVDLEGALFREPYLDNK